MKPRFVEGVPYYRFVIRYKLTDGRRRRMIRWSPGFPWIREEVARELDELDDVDPSRVSIDQVDLVKLKLVKRARARRKR